MGCLNHIHNFSSSPFRSRFEHQFGDAAEYLKAPGSLWHHTDPKEKNCEKVRVCSFGSDFEYLYVAWCTYLKLSRYLSWASSTGTGSMTGSKGKRVLFCNIFELGCDFVPPGVSLSVSQFSCLWWRCSQKCEWTLQVTSGCQSLRLGFSEVWKLSDEESRSRLGGVAAPFSHNTECYLLCADLRRSSHRPSLFHRWV